MRHAISMALLLAAPATAQQLAPTPPTAYQRAIAAGYKAAMLCSGLFNAGRTERQVEADELAGIYPEYDTIVPTLSAAIDRRHGRVTVAYDANMPPRRAEWRPGRGCTTLPIGAQPIAGIVDDGAAAKPIAADPRRWPMGDAGIAPRAPARLTDHVAAAFADGYGPGAKTIGVVIVRDGAIVAEHYAAGWGPLVANRTWSVGKSIAGTLTGIALGQRSLRPSATTTIWNAMGDPRGEITYDHLLRMASGLHSDTAGNRTDAIYFGGTSVTEQAPGWPLEARPGTRFRYSNNDILLAVASLRNVLGHDYQDMPRRALFAPLGMSHTVAETDWLGNYVLSSQVWSTARDLARLGHFWLQDGMWDGKRLLPAGWMTYMTTPSGPQPESGPGYGATMWLFGPKQGLPAGSYAAQGNRGQYVMVIPSRRLVIVRRGEDPGPARFDIARFAADVIAATR